MIFTLIQNNYALLPALNNPSYLFVHLMYYHAYSYSNIFCMSCILQLDVFLTITHTNLPVTLGVVELLTMLVVRFLGVDSENVYKLISKAKIHIMKNSTIK